ncbi:MAG: hypothetical protein AMXMBFR46_00750 [Acidimicrobiia bacterium]
MRKHTRHRRLVRGLGGFLSATLLAGSLALVLGGGVASAEGSTTWVLAPNTAPSNLQQNTRGLPAAPPISSFGGGAGWSFQIQGDWDAGDTFDVTVAPGDYDGTPGVNCMVPYNPQGVNQSHPDESNYVGFSGLNNTNTVAQTSTSPVAPAPVFSISVLNQIPCTGDAEPASYATLRLTATNNGAGQANQMASVSIGWSEFASPPPNAIYGPVLFDVGFGATTGPAHFTGSGFAVESSVTVTGERPSANNPRSTLVRNTATDLVGGPIAEFKIDENVASALPPWDGYTAWPPNPATEDLTRHLIDANPPGKVCLGIDNNSGNGLVFGATPGWSVNPGASSAGNSASAGGSATALRAGNTVAELPVNIASNKPVTQWTTSGLSLAGLARTDGPVWAYVWWIQGEQSQCGPTSQRDINRILGYVQLATISEQADAIFGHNAESTAAQAINHQFDYAKGDCVSNTIWRDYIYGPTIFLARSDYFADGLGAAYAAGTVESGVLLTPPNSLDPRTKDTIRLQGAQTVFVVGGPLAISDAVVNELKATTAFQCGGTSPRLDPNTGLEKKLVVIRIAGNTVWDTNARLAEFVGAEPPAAFGAFGANSPTNPFNTAGGTSQWGTAPGAPVNTALLVTGDWFQDAMVASVPAYGGWMQTPIGNGGPMPLIATPSCSVSQAAIDAMFNQHIKQLIVVGGPMAVCDSVVSAYLGAVPGLSAFRVAGANASETSTNLAAFELSSALGMGWNNVDFQWDNYVNRTAGNINFNRNEQVTAHTVLMARGDWFADAMSAAAVLSVHNGRYNVCDLDIPDDNQNRHYHECVKFPLIITESPTSLGSAVTSFLTSSSLYISGLTGAVPSGGLMPGNPVSPAGDQVVDESSNVFTIQPIGGPLALSPSILTAAARTIGS